jgi:PilZ domain
MTTPKAQSSRGDAEGRRRERRSVALSAIVTLQDGIQHPVDITNINYGGCGIVIPVELKPDEIVKLSIPGRGSILAEVKWCSDGRAGLQFEPADKAAYESVERRTGRAEVVAEATLRMLGRNAHRVRVRDLSTDGCKVELVEQPREGDTVSIKFDGLEALEAAVSWVFGHTAGLAFKNPIHPAVFDLLLQRLGAG